MKNLGPGTTFVTPRSPRVQAQKTPIDMMIHLVMSLSHCATAEEEITEPDEDDDITLNFMDWRKDGWASLRIGSRDDRSKLKRRKIRPHLHPDLLVRRGRLDKKKDKEKIDESAEMNQIKIEDRGEGG